MAARRVTSKAQQGRNVRALDASIATISAVLFAAVEPQNILAEMDIIGAEVTNAIKLSLQGPGSGRTYRRGRVIHQASAPGQPPATDHGRLIGSYTWQTGTDGKGPFVDIGTSVAYAPHLEYGTSKMAARPHFRPAIEAQVDNMANRFRERIARNIRDVVRSMPNTIEIK